MESSITITRGGCSAVLYCADCLDVLPGLSGVDVVVTDPPFDISAASGGIGGRRKYLADIRGVMDEGFDHSILNQFPSWMVFCSKSTIAALIQRAEAENLRWQILTWNKTNPTPLSNGNYLPDAEYIIHAFLKLPKCDFKDKSRWISGAVEQNDIDHPTVKPLYVMLKLLSTACAPGATVLDPYMGSGTTGIACLRTGRNFIGIEKDPKHFATAVARIRREADQALLDIGAQPVMEQTEIL